MAKPVVETGSQWMNDITQRIIKLERRLFGGTSTGDAGDVKLTARSNASVPTGWLLCDGAAVSRTTYAALFAAIGTAYGVGNGTTTFNLPNLKGRIPVGQDAAQTEFDVRGETGGAKTHTLTVAQMPAHGHQQRMTTSSVAPGGGSAVGGMTISGGTVPGTPVEQTTVDTGGGGAHNNLQPYVVMNYIIHI